MWNYFHHPGIFTFYHYPLEDFTLSDGSMYLILHYIESSTPTVHACVPYGGSFMGGIFMMGLGGNESSDDGSMRLEYHSVLYQGNNSSGEHPRYGGSAYINTTNNPEDGLGTASGLYFCRCFAIDQDQSYTCSSLQ